MTPRRCTRAGISVTDLDVMSHDRVRLRTPKGVCDDTETPCAFGTCCWCSSRRWPAAVRSEPAGTADSAAPASPPASAVNRVEAEPPAGEWFTDRARESGIDFVHFNGMTRQVLPAGNHGARRRALRLRQRRRPRRLSGAGSDARHRARRCCPRRLARSRIGCIATISQVEARWHARAPLHRRHQQQRHQHRAATAWASPPATIDNDGWIDLYLTGFGRNQMFRNNGNGTFTDVSTISPAPTTRRRGACPPRSSTSIATDWLDLFVGQLPELHARRQHALLRRCPARRDYCRARRVPRAAEPAVSQPPATASSPTSPSPPGVGARSSDRRSASSTADFNGDGWLDLFVANDEQENQLWINQHDGTFKNTALLAGAALGAAGKRKAEHGCRRRRLRR